MCTVAHTAVRRVAFLEHGPSRIQTLGPQAGIHARWGDVQAVAHGPAVRSWMLMVYDARRTATDVVSEVRVESRHE